MYQNNTAAAPSLDGWSSSQLGCGYNVWSTAVMPLHGRCATCIKKNKNRLLQGWSWDRECWYSIRQWSAEFELVTIIKIRKNGINCCCFFLFVCWGCPFIFNLNVRLRRLELFSPNKWVKHPFTLQIYSGSHWHNIIILFPVPLWLHCFHLREFWSTCDKEPISFECMPFTFT